MNRFQLDIEAKVGRGYDPTKFGRAICDFNELDGWADNEGNVWFPVLNSVDIYINEEN